ncbi:MAG: folate-binding protein YgfZ [Alphaproteobacteria bacterium]|nr:folate-binding protein YgfZ [Alphaproteobacteria bacterium]
MTQPASFVPLPARGLIQLSGSDARDFLQGLISNDIAKVRPERAIYAALLSPQGKFLHDFIVASLGDVLVLDCERARLGDLGQRLAGYRLRARVELADASDDFRLVAVLGDDVHGRFGLPDEPGACAAFTGGLALVDPRDRRLGVRVIIPVTSGTAPLTALGLTEAPFDRYEALRLSLGVPDGSRDLVIDKAILVESNFEALNGVDFAKGCYVGQELTARTKYRGLAKRRLMRVRIEGATPAPGTILSIDGKEAGEMRTAMSNLGLALVRLDRLDEASGAPLMAGATQVWPIIDEPGPS